MTVALKIHVEPLPEGMWADANRVDAFEEMYRRCYPPLVDLCRRIMCGRGDAEAVAQEAFVRAWASLDRFSGARPFWPWVATIARRLCIDNRRRLDRESVNLPIEAAAFEALVVAPEELVEADEEGRSAVRALKGLKPSEQRVITLRDVYEWSYDDIARFEGVTIESIRGSLKRARASLRKSYGKLFEESGTRRRDPIGALACATTGASASPMNGADRPPRRRFDGTATDRWPEDPSNENNRTRRIAGNVK